MVLPAISSIRNFAGKRVFLRVDVNVPLVAEDRTVRVADDWRIRMVVPTIEFLISRGARVVIGAHLGRPEKKKEAALSLRPVARRLGELLKKNVAWNDKIEQSDAWKEQRPGSILMLENLRFWSGEEENSAAFSRKLAALAEVYVNDAFAECHREHASVVAITKQLPHYAGLLLEKEVDALRRVQHAPKRPMVVVLGGAKVEGKLSVLQSLLDVSDHVVVGGLPYVAYLHARGYRIGGHEFLDDVLRQADALIGKRKVLRPIDLVIGRADGSEAQAHELSRGGHLRVAQSHEIFDIGPESILQIGMLLEKAHTIIWNGAMGKFEQHPYEYGTYAIARMMGAASLRGAFTVAGGGETIQALEDVGVRDKLSHVSTGGGAMLAFLAGAPMPGIEALIARHSGAKPASG